MKKKNNKKFFAIILAIFSLTLGSCNKPKPYDGDERYQIYQKAVTDDSFEGTYEEWLDSIKGEDGKDGKDGITPYIGENGNWWIGDVDTGISATGPKGDIGLTGSSGPKGDQGEPGQDGADGIDGKDGEKGDKGDTGEQGPKGDKGDTGEPGQDGNDGIDGKDGEKGDKGDTGEQGPRGDKGDQGNDGKTPHIGENGNWWIGTYDTGISATGANGEKGNKGDTGDVGKSAYDLYCEAHPEYDKTEAEWLDDLINGRLGNKEIHTVTFISNGGNQVETQYIYHGEKVTRPSVSREGYILKGWYIDDEKWVFNGYPVTYDMTLKAEWKANVYQVVFNIGLTEEIVQNYIFDEYVILPVPEAREGYDFLGWKYENEYITDGPWKIASDITLVGNWEKGTYFIYYDFGYDGIEERQKVIFGENYELLVPTRKGYTFNGWYFGTELFSAEGLWNIESSLELLADWTVNAFTITLDLNGGTFANSGNKNTYEINFGEGYTLPIVVAYGEDPFTGWYYQGTRLTNELGVSLSGYLFTEDITVKAEFFAPIYTRTDLENITENLSASYKLMNNIDLSNKEWTPINNFEGSLDGQDYTISGMTINTYHENVGLFGSAGNATIANLEIVSTTIEITTKITDEYLYLGSIIGSTLVKKDVVLNNVVVRDTQFNIAYRGTKEVYIGGFIGSTDTLTIIDSYNNSKIIGNNRVGGLVGTAVNLTIIDSYNNSEIIGTNRVGGLVGYAYNVTITGSSNNGEVNGVDEIGGLIGYSSTLTITESNNLGEVNGYSRVGGLGGYSRRLIVIDSNNEGGIHGNNRVGGFVGLSDGSITINSSCNSGVVTGVFEVGGHVGYYDSGSANIFLTITKSCNIGEIIGSGDYIGGLAGSVGRSYITYIDVTIIDSHNGGKVIGGDYVGGLAGYCKSRGSDSFNIVNSYNRGEVVGAVNVGGLIGYSNLIKINDSINNGEVNGNNRVGGLVGFSERILTITNGYNTGTIVGIDFVGGLVGYFYEANLTITESFNSGQVTGRNRVGGLIGQHSTSATNYRLTIISSSNIGEINGSGNYIGGLVGYASNDTIITDSFNSGKVTGKNYVGGIVAQSVRTEVTGCYNNGNVTGLDYVGGLVANSIASFTIISSYNIGDISGRDYIGGLIGHNNSISTNNSLVISESFNAGMINGKNYVGGLVGFVFGPSFLTITNSFNNSEIIGGNYIGGLVGSSSSLMVTNSYSAGGISGNNNIGGIVGASEIADIMNSINFGNVKGSTNVGSIIGENINNSTLIINSYFTNEILDEENNSFIDPTIGGIYIDAEEINRSFLSDEFGWDQEAWDFDDINIKQDIYPALLAINM